MDLTAVQSLIFEINNAHNDGFSDFRPTTRVINGQEYFVVECSGPISEADPSGTRSLQIPL